MGLRSFFQILPPRLLYADIVAPAKTLPVPSKIRLLWHKKLPSDIGLHVGDKVNTGQDLARNGKGPFISTVTGRIEEINDFNGPNGHKYVAVVIGQNTKDSFDPSLKPVEDFSLADPVELRMAINRTGFSVISLISSDPSIWPSIDTLIVSALDIDPLSVANQQAFRDHSEQVEVGVELLARATGVSRCVVAIPDNLAELAGNIPHKVAKVVIIPAVYPNGLPDILAKNYGAGFLIKRNENSVVVGNTLVVSVEQAIAMVECLKTGKPLTEKTVTFSAGKNSKVKNFRVRIGMPVADILKNADMGLKKKGKLILNGTMCGYACFSEDQPVTALTDCIHVQAPSEVFSFHNIACTNCGKCSAICPVDLEVNLLGRFSQYGMFDKCRNLGAENCIECGLCAYVCPARRPLVQFITHAKHIIQTEALKEISMEETLVEIENEHPHPVIRLFETKGEEKRSPKE